MKQKFEKKEVLGAWGWPSIYVFIGTAGFAEVRTLIGALWLLTWLYISFLQWKIQSKRIFVRGLKHGNSRTD